MFANRSLEKTEYAGSPLKKRTGSFYLWMGMLIPALTMLIGFIVNGVWPFGDGTILKVDSLHQYLPFFTDFHQKLRSGDSLFYSFSGGLGYDFWSTVAYYLASPLNMLIVLVPKANVCDFMDVMILLKVSACGGIFSWYLHRRNPSAAFLPLVFGTMYAMGNFYIGYSFNIMWLDSMAVVPLIMFGIEKLVKGSGRGGYVYGISLFYGLWCNYYIGFMLCIFSCLYLAVCLVCASGNDTRPSQSEDGSVPDEDRPVRSGFSRLAATCLSFGWYSLLAGGMSAVMLLPAYLSLTSSESMISNNLPSKLKFYTDFLSMYMSHFINAKPINISDSQVGFNAYCGTIVPLLLICYLTERRIRLREKLAHLALAGILFSSVTVNYLNYMWHGFHTQNGLPNRFAFLYVLIILLLAYDSLSRIRELEIWKVLFSGIVILALTIWTVLTRTPGENWADGIFSVLPVVMTAIYVGALALIVALGPKQKTISMILGIVMLLEASGHGIYGMCENGSVTRSIYLKDQASYQKLTGRQQDDSFFRSEIDSQRMRNVTIFAGGHSTVLFNSTMAESVTDFFDHIGIEARTNKNGYNGVTRMMNDVFGIRYVLASIGIGNTLYGFPKIDEDDNLKMYRNDHALSLGFVVNEEIRDWDIHDGTPIGVQNSFARLAAGVEDMYMLDRTVDAEDGEKIEVKVPENKQVYLYLPDKIDKFSLNTPEYRRNYETYNDHLYTMCRLGDSAIGDFTCDLKASQETVRVNIYTCPDAACDQVYEVLSESQLENVKADHARVTGTLDAKKDGILLLTLPYDQDWKVRLDGQETTPEVIGSALIGIPVSKGSHTLLMNFVPGGFYLGLLISLICLALMMITLLLDRRKVSALPPGSTQVPDLFASSGTAHVWKLAIDPKTGSRDDTEAENMFDQTPENGPESEQEEQEHD